jgi:hypothetical protein
MTELEFIVCQFTKYVLTNFKTKYSNYSSIWYPNLSKNDHGINNLDIELINSIQKTHQAIKVKFPLSVFIKEKLIPMEMMMQSHFKVTIAKFDGTKNCYSIPLQELMDEYKTAKNQSQEYQEELSQLKKQQELDDLTILIKNSMEIKEVIQ